MASAIRCLNTVLYANSRSPQFPQGTFCDRNRTESVRGPRKARYICPCEWVRRESPGVPHISACGCWTFLTASCPRDAGHTCIHWCGCNSAKGLVPQRYSMLLWSCSEWVNSTVSHRSLTTQDTTPPVIVWDRRCPSQNTTSFLGE
jgi:hypothetical protein